MSCRKKTMKILTDRSCPFLQFAKYGVFGGMATAVDLFVFYLLAILVFPAVAENDWLVDLFQLNLRVISETVRARNFAVCSCFSFVAGSTVAYITNILWVFDSTPGRRHCEIILFLIFSGLSMVISTGCGWMIIYLFNVQTSVSFVAKVTVSLLVNFAARKFVIFRSGLALGSQAG